MAQPGEYFRMPGEVALDGVAITKSDSTVFTPPLKCIYVGGTGDVTIRTPSGATLLFKAVPAGMVLPWAADQVRSTGTGATDMIGGW